MASIKKLFAFLVRFSNRSRASRIRIGLVIVAGMISGLASTGLIAVINNALHDPRASGRWLGVAFVGLCVALPLARFVSNVMLIRLTQATVYDLRIHLSRRILAAPLRKLEELGPHRLLATITDDVGTITGALTNIPLLCMHLTVVLGCLGYLGWLSWRMLLVVLATVLVGVVTYQIPVRRALRHFRIGREQWDRMFQHFRAVTQGTKELKVHRPRRDAFFRDHLEATAATLRHHSVAGNTIHTIANSWGQILFFVLIGVILFVAPQFQAADAEVLTGYTLAILYMLTPLEVLMNMIPGLGRATVSVDKVESLGIALDEEWREAASVPEAAPSPWRELALVGATHSYFREEAEETFTLGPIDLRVRTGELVFLVGGNGSGKTTLAKLLIGLYLPEQGEIRLDGVRMTEETIESYRQRFSVVFTDFFLFENLIGLDAEDLDDQAREYLRQLHLQHKVKVENGTISTLDLSQGQRKRLALLTAYLEDRPIYLFDEWAADQDPQFKEIFYHELLPELRARGKTVIVISHDDRYYHVADRIVKLNYGEIEYDGEVSGYLGLYGLEEPARERRVVL